MTSSETAGVYRSQQTCEKCGGVAEYTRLIAKPGQTGSLHKDCRDCGFVEDRLIREDKPLLDIGRKRAGYVFLAALIGGFLLVPIVRNDWGSFMWGIGTLVAIAGITAVCMGAENVEKRTGIPVASVGAIMLTTAFLGLMAWFLFSGRWWVPLIILGPVALLAAIFDESTPIARRMREHR